MKSDNRVNNGDDKIKKNNNKISKDKIRHDDQINKNNNKTKKSII